MPVGNKDIENAELHSAGLVNTRLLVISNCLMFFAAPVVYVGVVQAALCNKLGATATIANLPASAYFFGCLVPIFLARVLPYRLERSAVVGAYVVTSLLLASVFLTLVLPLGNGVRILVLIAQGLIQGFASSVAQVYMYQCMGRGTTEKQRARAMRLIFTYGPIAAVLGSLGAQFILNRGIGFLVYPHDFAFLFLLAIPCTVGAAYFSSRYKLIPVHEPARYKDQPFLSFIQQATKSFVSDRRLLWLWFAYLFWYFTLNAMPNLTLYASEAMGKEPAEISGVAMALRFGFKSLGGFMLGTIALKYGHKSPLIVAVLLLGAAPIWVWSVHGVYFLFAFGLMGAGELGGAYFPNYGVTLSTPTTGAVNLAILSLVTPVSSIAPVIHGALTDNFGFRASFVFGIATACLALLLLLYQPNVAQGTKDVA